MRSQEQASAPASCSMSSIRREDVYKRQYVGDALALAVVNHRESLDEVLGLIELDAEELQPVTDPRKALEEDAPKVHEEGNLLAKKQCIRGDADTAVKLSLIHI